MAMLDQVKLIPQFSNTVTEKDKKFVQKIVEKNITGKMSSYFKKIIGKKHDAEVSLKYTITYHEESKKYDAKFVLNYDGNSAIYEQEGFSILADLVNHAFKRFKEKISAE